MVLHNYMENVVTHAVESFFSKEKIVCGCKKCRLDIMALTLNNLHPKYVATEQGRIYTRLEELEAQFKTDVLKEIIRAVKVVGDKPKH